MKSLRLSVLCSIVFSGCKNSSVEGTAPENTAVVCLPVLFKRRVKPIQAASWSTLGLVLTVTRIFWAVLSLSTTCCLAEASILFILLFYFDNFCHQINIPLMRGASSANSRTPVTRCQQLACAAAYLTARTKL